MSALCIPSMNAGLFDISDVPWTVIARHGSALVLYGIAIAQWPGLMVSDWAGEDRAFAYHLTSIMFTLSFWCAFFYHYLVSAGRVQIDWKTGKLKGKGWIVRTSRRAHRVLLSLTLAVSAMSIIQSITIAMIITHFYIKEDELEAKEHAILILLKIDQTLAFCIFIFVLGRLIFEPVSIRKHRRRSEAIERVGDPKQVLGSGSVDSLGLPEEAEECNICVENWANRILGCGHLLCCCCLAEIWKTGGYTTIQCPYCRANVNSIHKIRLSDGGYVEISNCCDDFLEVVDSPSSTTMDDIVDPTIIVRPPPE